MHPKVASSVPGQDAYLGCGFHSRLGHLREEANTDTNVGAFLLLKEGKDNKQDPVY